MKLSGHGMLQCVIYKMRVFNIVLNEGSHSGACEMMCALVSINTDTGHVDQFILSACCGICL
jgi:hypothetical protein